MRNRFIFLVIAVFLASCSSKDKGKKTIVEPETPRYSLEVSVGEGLSGSPASGIYWYKAGESVQYSYQTSEGYRNAYVVLDSVVISLSGSFAMQANKKIFVRAEKTPIVPQENKPVVETGNKILTSLDKPLAYAEYISALSKLYDQYSGEEAAMRAQAVSQSVFASVKFADLKSLQADLGGKVFSISSSSNAIPAGINASENLVGVDLLHINGMFTPEEDAALATLELDRAVRSSGLPFSVPIRLFYNSSAFRSISEKTFCLVSIGPVCLSGLASEVAEASQQLLSVLGVLDARASAEVDSLVSLVRASRAKNRAVVLIGHSQGTLFAQEALRRIGKDSCVAAISLAGPTGTGSWPISNPELSGFVVGGTRASDIILRLGSNNFPRIETSLTRSADQTVANATFLPEYTKLREEWRLHGILRSYLAASESRTLVAKNIADAAKMLSERKRCGPPAPPPPPPPPADTSKKIYAVSTVESGSLLASNLWVASLSATGRDSLVTRLKRSEGMEPVFIDISVSPSGEMWGITSSEGFPGLYRFDNEKKEMILVAHLVILKPRALEFDSKGNLYIVVASGRFYRIDFYGSVVSYPEIGYAGFFSDIGDMVAEKDGRFLLTVFDSDGSSRLMRFNPSLPGTATAVCQESIGFRGVEGLVSVNDNLFGLTYAESGQGELVSINTTTCKGTLIRKLSFSAMGATAPRE